MPQSPDCVEICINKIAQLSLFFIETLLFLADVVKTVCNKLFFATCSWKNSQINILLYSI